MASQVTVSQQHRCQQHESKPHRYATPSPGEEVVISGVAGRFPECDDMQALHDALQRGECLLTTNERRWNIDHPEMPKRTGKMHRLEKFDASFFRVHFKQAHAMDPQCRLLLERAYEAIVDAGINPKTLRGKRMGVYVGACFSEAEKTLFYEKVQVSGMGITGCCRAMLSNRISYWLGAKGGNLGSIVASPTEKTVARSGVCLGNLTLRHSRAGHIRPTREMIQYRQNAFLSLSEEINIAIPLI
ncbi:Fatty acid synthase [Gryllus bimaculatus]|nr:Fatty acid synthase [Gryllus bimaculatus]